MSLVKRIYVEKKPSFAVEAVETLKDLRDNLHISDISDLRVLYCYDIQGIDNNDYEICKERVFSEPLSDYVYDEEIQNVSENDFVFGVKSLPGQYDQKADVALQSVVVALNNEKEPIINASKFYVIKGNLSAEEKEKIKSYIINPIDSMEIGTVKKDKLIGTDESKISEIKIHDGFINMEKKELREYKDKLGMAMSNEDFLCIYDYFKNQEKRNPTDTELKVLDTYWSDHCRHTTFSTNIESIEFEDGYYKELFKDSYNIYLEERIKVYGDREKPITLMDMATIGMKSLRKKGLLNDLDESEEINACSIVAELDVDGKNEEWLIMFKNETHNHPTEIEPFGGANTCLGGAIRDPLSGRAYVYQAMRVTGSGNILEPVEDTIPGKLPQRKITIDAANGYSAYGNQIGLAAGHVSEIYHDGYKAKRMEVGAVVAAAKKENVVRERPVSGDIVLLVGGRTGRDGLGGATGSSQDHDAESLKDLGAQVQKGDPVLERKIQRLFRIPVVAKMIKRCNDFGAGGVSVAIGELADGLDINLDLVKTKYDGLDGTELAISESQERMAVVVDEKDKEKFIEFAEKENLEATEVAVVTDSGRLRMYWKDKDIVNISRAFLDTNGAVQYTNVVVEKYDKVHNQETIEGKNIKEKWLNNLKDINVASQKGLSEKFSSTDGGQTVLMPYGGKYQLTPSEVMAAKVPVGGSTNSATIMSYGYDPYLSEASPYHGALNAVVDSVTKIVAAGGDYKKIRLTFQEYFESLGQDSKKWGKPFIALLGAFNAQIKLGIPSVGGKDSMSGTFEDIHVPPTLISFGIAVENVNNIISNDFKESGNLLVEVNPKILNDDTPDFDSLTDIYEKVEKYIKEKKIVSAGTIGTGGIAAALSERAFGSKIGFEIDYSGDLFSPKYGSFILELNCNVNEAEKLFDGTDYQLLGETTDKDIFIVNGEEISLEESLEQWLNVFEPVFTTKPVIAAEKNDMDIKEKNFDVKSAAVKKAKPKVFIPIFPGANREYEICKQFIDAGADVNAVVFKNLNRDMYKETINEMKKAIDNADIIAFIGSHNGISGIGGSGKFTANVFENLFLKEAVTKLLEKREGLILGTGGGFQTLVQLGLVPYGEIRNDKENQIAITSDVVNRFTGKIVHTKIVSNKSPWLSNVELGDIVSAPVSHSEGRFVADEDVVEKLVENGQIASQYVDLNGKATDDINYNPSGSYYGIESVTSPDGRVLGKMTLPELNGENIYKNVVGEYSTNIFKAGVEYFK